SRRASPSSCWPTAERRHYREDMHMAFAVMAALRRHLFATSTAAVIGTAAILAPLPPRAVDIQFIHVRSRPPGAMPLVITHGWPGSILELLKVIDPLTDPTAHGGQA